MFSKYISANIGCVIDETFGNFTRMNRKMMPLDDTGPVVPSPEYEDMSANENE